MTGCIHKYHYVNPPAAAGGGRAVAFEFAGGDGDHFGPEHHTLHLGQPLLDEGLGMRRGEVERLDGGRLGQPHRVLLGRGQAIVDRLGHDLRETLHVGEGLPALMPVLHQLPRRHDERRLAQGME